MKGSKVVWLVCDLQRIGWGQERSMTAERGHGSADEVGKLKGAIDFAGCGGVKQGMVRQAAVEGENEKVG